ncbi:hypothetical protein [Bacillus niameyensis]|uniref:hypothetical protein n=1 Tax=Bacillus niameyensis TaxID=1522308 RepID=UPI0007846603|nr:hypothetical protein [Bacillus niameyensis]
MEWTLAILFIVSVILLIISFFTSGKDAKAKQKEIDMIHISVTNEIDEIKDSIRNIEFDLDIVFNESEVQLSAKERLFLREVLDLYKRNYSVENIAAMKESTESEIKQLLAPYVTPKEERRKVDQ